MSRRRPREEDGPPPSPARTVRWVDTAQQMKQNAAIAEARHGVAPPVVVFQPLWAVPAPVAPPPAMPAVVRVHDGFDQELIVELQLLEDDEVPPTERIATADK